MLLLNLRVSEGAGDTPGSRRMVPEGSSGLDVLRAMGWRAGSDVAADYTQIRLAAAASNLPASAPGLLSQLG